MDWYFTPQIIPLLVVVLISAAQTAYLWRHRTVPGALSASLLMLAITVWSFAYSLELTNHNLATRALLVKIEYIGIASAPLLWLLFALQYSGRDKWLRPRNVMGLSLIPATTLCLAWTNEAHHLIWRSRSISFIGDMVFHRYVYGVWFWIHTAYSYALLLLGTVIIILVVMHSVHFYRSQAIAVLIGALVPWGASVLYVVRLDLAPSLDLTPFAFTFTGAMFAWGLFRYRLFDLLPVARAAVVEEMADAVLVLDRRDRIADLNVAAHRLLRVPPQQAMGRFVTEGLRFEPGWIERVEAGGTAAVLEDTQDAYSRCYDARVSTLKDGRGQVSGRLIVLRDITERKQVELALQQRTEELQARNEELDAFAHTVAHDLKSPVHVISGYAELLMESYQDLGDEQVCAYLDTMLKTGRKMNAIIEELMLLAGLRDELPQVVPLDMALIVREAQSRLARLISEHRARIEAPATWPSVLGYAPWVEEVWVNYISNAVKYSGESPCINLGFDATAEPGMVRFWVRDNGPGIAPEDQARLFRPFTRLDQTRADGHGLGLSIARRIIERLGGTAGVESTGIPGQGSTFMFTLKQEET